MANDPSTDVTSQLATLLGSLTLSSGQPFPPPPPQISGSSLQTEFSHLHLLPEQRHGAAADIDTEMEQMDFSELGTSQQTHPSNRLAAVAAATTSPADGEESYLCIRCGSLISVARKDAHDQAWCPALHKELP